VAEDIVRKISSSTFS